MEKIKHFFDLVDNLGEGLHSKIHIIDISEYEFEEEDTMYRIYHADGYCLDVKRGMIDLTEDESCEHIDGYWYSFMDDLYEGFKECSIDEAIKLINQSI